MNTWIVVIFLIVVAIVVMLMAPNGSSVGGGGLLPDTAQCVFDADCQSGFCTPDVNSNYRTRICATPLGNNCTGQSACYIGPQTDKGNGVCGHSNSATNSQDICCPSTHSEFSFCTGRSYCTGILNSGEVCRLSGQCKSGRCIGNEGCKEGRCA